MSPIPVSTTTCIELGLPNHHVKEVQSCGDNAGSPPSVKLGLPNFLDLQVQHHINETKPVQDVQPCKDSIGPVPEILNCGNKAEPAHEIQPEAPKVLSHQEKMQAQLEEWRNFRKAHGPKSQPIKQDTSSSKEDAVSVKDIHPQDKTVNAFSQQKQAELEEWRNFRKAHDQIPKFQLNKEDAESMKDVQPESKDSDVNSFSQRKQAELDEWRAYRQAHQHVPENPINVLGDLFDMGYPKSETPVAPTVVEGISAWKKRKGKSRRFKSVSMP